MQPGSLPPGSLPPGALPPGAFPPGWDPEAQAALRRKRRRRGWIVSAVMAIVLAIYGGIAAVGTHAYRAHQAKVQAAYDLKYKGSWRQAKKMLADQSAALLRGDEKAWLAAVDARQPKLVTYYQQLYTGLHALRVTVWDYYPSDEANTPYTEDGTTAINLDFYIAYCLGVTKCQHGDPDSADNQDKVASIEQTLHLERVDGVYKITFAQQLNEDQTPWQVTDMTYKAGKRVVVGASPSLKGQLNTVVGIADAAAAAADHFAAYTGNRPAAYDVYMAGRTEWNSWYGGKEPDWAVGYAIQTGTQGTDVVLRLTYLDPSDLRDTIQHEFGHVVTLGGTGEDADSGNSDDHEWLTEGIADYIGQWPKPVKDSYRLAPLRSYGNIPTDIRIPGITDYSTDEDVDRLYGYGFLAVSCMATKYGEARMMKFTDLVLRNHISVEDAAPQGLGHNINDVNKTCSAYFRSVLK